MLFENINNSKENKPIHKHIKLKNRDIINLNQIQTAYKSQTNEHLNLNDLIGMSINLLIKETKSQIANKSELEAINFLKELKENL